MFSGIFMGKVGPTSGGGGVPHDMLRGAGFEKNQIAWWYSLKSKWFDHGVRIGFDSI